MFRTGTLNTSLASTSTAALQTCRPIHRQQRHGGCRVHAMADQMCRDMVNKQRERDPASGEGSDAVTVSFLGAGGQEISVQCPKDTYVLDAGLEAGIDLPYTCRGGICGACVGKLVSGTLDSSDIQDLSFTLTDEEQEEGMALLCMSRPESDCRIETQSDWGYSLGVAEWKGATGEISGRKVQPLTPWEEGSKGPV